MSLRSRFSPTVITVGKVRSQKCFDFNMLYLRTYWELEGNRGVSKYLLASTIHFSRRMSMVLTWLQMHTCFLAPMKSASERQVFPSNF